MDDNKVAVAVEGGEGEHLMDGGGGEGNDKDNIQLQGPSEDIAPAAFADINFETPPMIAISVAAPMTNYNENSNEVAIADAPINDDIVVSNNNLESELIEVNEDEDNSLPDEQWDMQIGSYCYIDDNDNVYGVVVDELQYGYFLIVDFFEKRKRKTHKKSLALIQNVKDFKKAKKQYLKYKRRKRKKSSNK
eukprot:UN07984